MTMAYSRRIVIWALLGLAILGSAQTLPPGRNKITIRGQNLDLYHVPAAGTGPDAKVLFAPGDGGWRGFALDIAENLAAAGFDVYGIDTRHYLQSFTGSTTLKTSDVASDFAQLAHAITPGRKERILLVGWSEGAGLGLAAASGDGRSAFAGLVAIGTPEYNILGWRWTDIGAEITKKLPNEPTFKSADFIARVSPLPLFMIASTQDEYISPDKTRALFNAANEPKRLVIINASNHKYGGNAEEFFRTLRGALSWIQQQSR